ncbi:purine-binding chemotaxis protein CheW [Endozoicomonas sp. SM1973]|uniref:Purine-binding chemotaxis protein CheW n=1 Tax=Spartinivicinus marinus TaxID=2994442 RepID=A0A853I514_9GAMM|nr:chemotaxis protein CheW [Spartinivicinus marinus]MCX4025795.1 chemotaxis protein CheW [Spartinivicinus marinus]NYZ65788.1 purine-binding chemotaxis protein CheW [Spartinivicinus marinus]
MQEQQAANTEEAQWLTFALEGEIYAVEVLRTLEILNFMELAPVPGAPDYVLGMISLRGEVININSLRLLLDLPGSDISKQSRIILLDISGQIQGILVDSVSEIISIKNAEIDSSNEHGTNCPFVIGTAHYEDDIIILISVEKLLAVDIS